MAGTATCARVIKDVNHGAVDVGHLDLAASPPKRASAEHQSSRDVVNRERHVLKRLLSLSHWPSGIDEDCPKELLGQIPVMRRTGTSDIARLEEFRYKGPRIFEHVVRWRRGQRNRSVQTAPEPPEPALAIPAGEGFRGDRPVDSQRMASVVDCDEFACGT